MINELDFPLLAGMLGAILHVVSGPDHLVAVAPFAIEEKKKSWKIGMFWGLGHLAGMLLIGLLVMIFKKVVPFEEISEYSERSVGIILVFLGVWILYKVYKSAEHQHYHPHQYEDDGHLYFYPHIRHQNGKKGFFATFFVGMIHGLAGVAHMIIFLPLIGFVSVFEIGKYLSGFGIGTLAAMISFTFLVGRFAIFTKADQNDIVFRNLRIISALAAILVGIYWFFSN